MANDNAACGGSTAIPTTIDVLFDALFEHAPIGKLLCALAPPYHLLRANVQANTWLQLTLPYRGVTRWTLSELVHPDDWPIERARWDRLHAQLARGHSHELRWRAGDASFRWYQTSVYVTSVSEADAPCVCVQLLDVHDHKLRWDELAAIKDYVLDGVFTWDVSQGTMVHNARFWRMLGYDPAAPPVDTTRPPAWPAVPTDLDPLSELIHPEDRPQVQRALQTHMAQPANTTYRTYLRYRRSNGQWQWVLRQGQVLEWTDHSRQRARRIVGTHTDVNALHQELDTAAQETRFRQHVVARMAHEIRTPLSAIHSLAEVFHDALPQQRDDVNTMLECLRHIRHITDETLTAAHVDHVGAASEPTATDIHAFLSALRGRFRHSVRRLQVTLTTTVNTATCHCRVQVHRLQQIMDNFVSNAFKFAPPGSTIEVCVSSPDAATLVWSVSDGGPGVDPEVAARLGQAFVTRSPNGTGLGLYTCFHLATQCGWTISHDALEPQGTRFALSVPYVPCDNPADIFSSSSSLSVANTVGSPASASASLPDSSESHPSPLTPPPSLHVLVVDDSAVLRRTLSLTLTRSGWTVDTVEDGADVTVVRARQYDVVLLDFWMPLENGVQTATRLRAAGYDGTIIGLTASTLTEEHRNGMTAGMDAVLHKPVSRTVLLNTMSRYHRARNGTGATTR